jgi:enoyl-CoA hydratase
MPVSDTSDVLLTRESGVVWATLNRAQTRNAINEGVVFGLEAAVLAAEEDGASVLVIRGAGGSFCSGADLHYLRQLREKGNRSIEHFTSRLEAVFCKFETAPFVTVAAVEGHAVAGGCELLLACDIALTTTDALIGDRHIEHDQFLSVAQSTRLRGALSKSRARYLLFTGEMISGSEAEAWGLVTRAYSPEAFEVGVKTVVERVSTRSRVGLAAVKRKLTEESEIAVNGAHWVEQSASSLYRNSSNDLLLVGDCVDHVAAAKA